MNILLYNFSDWLLANEEALPKGSGLFSSIHIALMALMAITIVVFYIAFKKHKAFALKLTTVLCYVMIISRLFRMVLLWTTGTNTFIEVLPWHLCHVMAFVFPAFYLTKSKKFFAPILGVTFYGGILTFIFGDYYAFKFFTFLDIESILLHFIMIAVSVACVATGYFKITLKDFWQIPIMLVLLVAHASLGNYFCKDQNFLFLRENGLPFNLFPNNSHIYTYFILVLFLFSLTYIPIIVQNYIIKKSQPPRKEDLIIEDDLDDMPEPALR